MTEGPPLYGARATDVIDAMMPESARDAMQRAEQHRVSTDPNWCKPNDQAKSATVGPGGEPAATGCQPGPVRRPAPPDGRSMRAEETKANVLAACRELMIGGVFRPTMEEVCELARRSKRSGHKHFTSIEALHFEALQDGAVREAVLRLVLGNDSEIPEGWTYDGERILRAIITGKA